MDATKLSPAPWGWTVDDPADATHKGLLRDADGKCVLSPTNEGDIAISETEAEFIPLARNAFDVMMRRGWDVNRHIPNGRHGPTPDGEGKWVVSFALADRLHEVVGNDPFTALIEAEKWYVKNVENKQAAAK